MLKEKFDQYRLVLQVAKGIVQPHISFCNKRYASMITHLALTKFSRAFLEKTQFKVDLPKDPDRAQAIIEFRNVLFSLDHIASKLMTFEEDAGNLTSAERELLRQWSEVSDDLYSRWLLTSLLAIPSHDANLQSKRIIMLKDNIDDAMLYCGGKQGRCNTQYMKSFLSVENLNCFAYDATEGQPLKESTVQGIENGITFVFMTGSKILASEFNQSVMWFLPGFNNTFHTSAGGEGYRLMIHAPYNAPMPDRRSRHLSGHGHCRRGLIR